MRRNRPLELQELQNRLRALLRANMGEARRTRELLRDTERKVEDQFGHLDFMETAWYTAGKKFRKEPVAGSPQNNATRRTPEHRAPPTSINTRSNAPQSANRPELPKPAAIQNIAGSL